MALHHPQPTDLLTWALLYARRGWPALPLHGWDGQRCTCGQSDCTSPAKHPRTPHGLKDASVDPATITDWWRRWPTANIGLRTGVAFDVLDIDGDEGWASVAELENEHGTGHQGPTTITGGGGSHRLYQPTGIGNRAGIVNHVDWRGTNGYIVAPPSIHATGNRYEWIPDLDQTTPLPPVDGWLQELLFPPKHPRSSSTPPTERRAQGGSEYGKTALDAEINQLAGAVTGTRNASLNEAAFNLYQLVAGGELDEHEVTARLTGTAQQIGLGQHEIDATINSARKAGLASPRSAPAFTVITGARSRKATAPPPPRIEGIHYEATDLGNARRLIADHGADFRYIPQWGKWLHWTGTHWAEDITGEIVRRSKHVTETILDEARGASDGKLFTWGIKSQSASRINAAVTLAQTEPGTAVLSDNLDADQWLLSVANGTLHLTDSTLRAHRRDDHITKIVDRVAWNPDAQCPTFLTFLEQILPDIEVRHFIQRAVGYALTGDVTEQILIICHGAGSNGKSTLMNILQELLGEYAGPASPRLLVADKHSEHPTAIADLHGKRLVVAQEIAQGSRLDEELVKQLTGGDKLSARFMRQDFWTFKPTHKMWLCTNHRPVVRGTDHAIWRRIRLIPFDVVIPDDQQDKALGTKLEAELPGILKWAVEGCQHWLDGGLQAPAIVMAATDAYRRDMDLISQFLSDTCIINSMMKVRSTELYVTYKTWCDTNGIKHPLTQKGLAARLVDNGLQREEDRARHSWWAGIGIKTEQQQEDF